MSIVSASPEETVKLLDQAFAQGDVEAVLSFYEKGAVVVTEPGKTIRGTEELRHFFERAMQPGVSAKQLRTHVIEAGGLALFLSRWTLETKGGGDEETSTRQFIATTVFRKQTDGSWKAVIDNPIGPLVLGAD